MRKEASSSYTSAILVKSKEEENAKELGSAPWTKNDRDKDDMDMLEKGKTEASSETFCFHSEDEILYKHALKCCNYEYGKAMKAQAM
ncbi:uncharacterized protein K452DRAFT_296818 [Aplosporella prunicola CBS 121167]|uniref:Uncharacterized protein n=1 Tax=Aplosporella prunicola CBS 121167 TaxID=1176127 RepID=A0A6A6BKQ0_9PEZI|nr:uncharacterized protein K452DRAFT_296818 [Aplosporella prunicola CBS 121167]KAF2143844.1 hypothetical protein K452DRAFT_296818 [Aplosporella prunicola CBS 121167]